MYQPGMLFRFRKMSYSQEYKEGFLNYNKFFILWTGSITVWYPGIQIPQLI